jgi:hypothetical protein
VPGLNGRGPMGGGPMTGGGRGLCNPYGRTYAFSGYGRGRGFRGGFGPGFGRGRGYARGFGWREYYPAWGEFYGPAYGQPYGSPPTMDPEDEINVLRDEVTFIERDLDSINKRIKELESAPSTA